MDDPRTTDQQADDATPQDGVQSRRHLLAQAAGGAAFFGLAATGALALRRADAKDDDDDENDSSGSGSGGDGDGDGDNSGSGSGGDDHSGHGGDDDDDDDRGDDDRGDGDDDRDDDGEDRRDDDDVVVTGTVPAGAVEVRIVDDDADGFSPGAVTVDLGASVTFVNADDDPHTATGAGFDTGIIQPGAAVTVTLDTPGTRFYACLIHPEMTGTVVVRDADGALPGATPGATPDATPAVARPSGGETATVAIRGFAFDPPTLTVSPGTTVTWENADSAPHTATGEDGDFDTGRIDAAANGTATFAQPGAFAYRCEFHPDMVGEIVVE